MYLQPMVRVAFGATVAADVRHVNLSKAVGSAPEWPALTVCHDGPFPWLVPGRRAVQVLPMIERQAQQDGVQSTAYYSPCARYRYGLRRVWAAGPEILYVMLNPSTATELANDPTIERCQRRAVMLGYGGMRIANLFAYRATHPKDLSHATDPEGPENADLLASWCAEAQVILAAWGVHGALNGQGPRMAAQLTGDVRHLGLTKAGHPRHPLYVSYDVVPQDWPAATRYSGK